MEFLGSGFYANIYPVPLDQTFGIMTGMWNISDMSTISCLFVGSSGPRAVHKELNRVIGELNLELNDKTEVYDRIDDFLKYADAELENDTLESFQIDTPK